MPIYAGYDGDEIEEPTLIPKGTKTVLTISQPPLVKMTEDRGKGSKMGMTVFLTPSEYTQAEDFIEWFEIPTAERKAEDPRNTYRSEVRLKHFEKCFGIKLNEDEPDDVVGRTGQVVVAVRTEDGVERNRVGAYLPPHDTDEDEEGLDADEDLEFEDEEEDLPI